MNPLSCAGDNKEGKAGAGLKPGGKIWPVYYGYFYTTQIRGFTREEFELEEQRRKQLSIPMVAQRPASGEHHLRQLAAAHTSPPPRASLVGLPTVAHHNHLLRSQHCDLKLDSTLCNAHTSGTDALWAGTPMLTLPGETQAARVALSLVRSVG